MKIVKFKDTIDQRLIITDAVLSQNKPFDSVIIMRYISDNEENEKTFDHHDIGFFIEELVNKGIVKRSDKYISEFTTYEVAI